MNITVPIYAEEQAPSGALGACPSCSPLFFDPIEQDESVQRGTARLARELRRELTRLVRSARHEEFAAYSFYPPLEDRILKLKLEVGNRRFEVSHLFVTVPAFGRRFASTPSVPELWFEIGRGETLQRRASEVLTEHYKLLERVRALMLRVRMRQASEVKPDYVNRIISGCAERLRATRRQHLCDAGCQ